MEYSTRPPLNTKYTYRSAALAVDVACASARGARLARAVLAIAIAIILFSNSIHATIWLSNIV